MAYIYDEPLNNRSGIGGKEKMEREHAVGEMGEQLEEDRPEVAERAEAQREADKAEAEAEKKAIAEKMEERAEAEESKA